jgi:LPXTG-site transpeptidase (sortase) family protein
VGPGREGAVFAFRTLVEFFSIFFTALAFVLAMAVRLTRFAARHLPRVHAHVPRSDIEVAIAAGSIAVGLLVGAVLAARELANSAQPQIVVERPAAVEVAPAPEPTATEQRLTPISDVPIRTRLLPRLKIDELKVDTDLQPVGLTRTGAMDVPTNGETVAWYSLGPFPGSSGNAVLAGHVDWARRPGVFNKLRNLAPGSRISLDFDLGAELDYRVTWVEQFRAQTAPLARIFEQNTGSALTLITCGGTFDNNARAYLDRIVVRAVRA